MAEQPAPSTPLVSVLLINWNYAPYVGMAINSIKSQSYKNIDVVVVDNGSTDNSFDVITARIGDDPRFRVVRYAKNRGQLGAFFSAYKQLKGDYVVSVDADDVLMSNFIASHVQTHLSLAGSVAMTSSDVAIIGSDNKVLMHGYRARAHHKPDSTGFPDNDDPTRLAVVTDDEYRSLNESVSVHHGSVNWIWGPGTSNMYQRSILDMVYERRRGPWMRSSDNFLNPIVHAVGGSALIDQELSAYRLHGANYYGSLQVAGGGRRDREARLNQQKDLYETVDSLLRRAKAYSAALNGRYWDVFADVSKFISSPGGKILPGSPETLALLQRNYATLCDVFGKDETQRQLQKSFMPGDVMMTSIQAGDQIITALHKS